MPITTTTLTRAAGAAAVTAGLLFVAVQVKHPEITVDFVQGTQWTVRQSMKVSMAVLALAGIAGMYLSQVRRMGVLGLVGWLLFSLGYLMMLCVEMIALVVVPTIATSSPDYVRGVIAVATNSSSTTDLGAFTTLNLAVAAGYLLGGLVFGVALFRAGVLARWACALLAVAAVATMAIPLLPMVNQRLFAVPNGIAMIGLGVSLWRKSRSAATGSTSLTADAQLDPAGAR
jgi:hypothetical protein